MTNMEVARWAFVYLVTLNIVAYVGFLCWGWWSKRRALTKAWRRYKVTGYKVTGITTQAAPPSPSKISAQGYATTGVTPKVLPHQQFRALQQQNWTTSQRWIAAMIKDIEGPVELEETWSNEKVEAWRVIDVTVEKGDDGLWLGFPHPDGPTEDVVTPMRHPIGVELHAECRPSRYPCDDVPSEYCQSEIGYGCGFYAFKTREQADTFALLSMSSGCIGIARVLLSGKVIEHENGYRAEILEVVSVESVSYHGSLLSVIGATTRAFNAFTDIVSGGV